MKYKRAINSREAHPKTLMGLGLILTNWPTLLNIREAHIRKYETHKIEYTKIINNIKYESKEDALIMIIADSQWIG